MKILLVEDERELSAAVTRMLRHSGFTVDAVYDGEEALEYIGAAEYDVVILDIMLPKLDGISVVKTLRSIGNNIPVLMLTAKAETDDKVLGLNSGADDYMTKPFAMKELIARLRALERRQNSEVKIYKMGNVELNPDTNELTAVSSVRLTRKEFQLMELMLLNPNKYISAEKFMDRIWDYDSEADISVVWVFISALRKKLASIAADVEIKAVRSVGYRLEEKTRKG